MIRPVGHAEGDPVRRPLRARFFAGRWRWVVPVGAAFYFQYRDFVLFAVTLDFALGISGLLCAFLVGVFVIGAFCDDGVFHVYFAGGITRQ